MNIHDESKWHFEKGSDGKIEVWIEVELDFWEVMGAGETKEAALESARQTVKDWPK